MGGVGSAQVWLCGSPLGENGCPVSESIGSVAKEKAAVKVYCTPAHNRVEPLYCGHLNWGHSKVSCI